MGWECAGVSEIDPFPRAVLQHRLGAVPVDDDHRWQPGQNFIPLFGDFTKIEAHHVGAIDVLVGGTPCQSFSIAGKRLGLDDPRGNLTLEFLALAKRLRPRWILWENVPGVLSHDEGRTFGTFLGFLAECGFERWAYRVLDAQYCRVGRFGRAVPQRRRRVFVVGYSGTAAIHPRAVLFDRESLRGNPAPRRETRQGAAGSSAKGTTGSSERQEGLTAETAGPLTAGMHKGPRGTEAIESDHVLPVTHSLRGEGFDASEKVTIAFTVKDHGGDAVENISPTLRAGGHTGSHANAGVMPAIAFPTEMSATQCASTEELSPALSVKHTTAVAFDMRGREGGAMPEGPHDTANIRAASGGSSRSYAASQAWGVRRLTPTECARLQGFPDDWAKIPWRGKPAEQCPDGPQYKAYGNSMAVNVMCWLGERIAAVAAAGEGEKRCR
jgi:DNA (cytosine-5)-methyltransferase 1